VNADDWLDVESLDLDGQGVAHDAQGKVVFIEGALPIERVQVRVHRRKEAFEQGVVTAIQRESAQRVRPPCPHFGLHAGACGGCKLQHLDATAQVAVKQRALESTLWHVGRVKPERVLRPIEGRSLGYRERARLSVRYVAKKGGVLVGFHERKSSYIADMRSCAVLAPRVSALLLPLRSLIETLAIRDRVPQIEVAVGDETVVFVLRHLQDVEPGDRELLRNFAKDHGVVWWLQPGGPDSAAPLDEPSQPLRYALPAFGVDIEFRPTDFTQVNHGVNQVLVSKALSLLAVTPQDTVIDWFCGLGNFSLPLATQAQRVLGVEGSEGLVARARANARRHGLDRRCTFEAINLFEVDAARLAQWPHAQRWLIDPPREGAMALVKALADLREADPQHPAAPERIVYVSCNPATLARDANVLVQNTGYQLEAAGAVNMFAHTAHVESLALFTRQEKRAPVKEPLA
jgi:23S rRNA (uracil1939-C5)-methyltransferase